MTEGTLLGGRVRHWQPPDGHRTSLEPVLLAASIPARPGQRVIEAGTGVGSALLCLAARVDGVLGLGIERDPELAEIARHNVAANGFSGLAIATADVTGWESEAGYDHALANPPWHDAAGTVSADPRRDAARRAKPALFAAWATALARAVMPRGTVSFILGADHLAGGLAAMTAAGCGSLAIFPFWSKPGRPARLVLIRAVQGGRGPTTLLAGLVLHQASGAFTPEADAVLRDGAGLTLG